MPQPRLEETAEFLTLPQVAKALGMGEPAVLLRIERGLLPPPTQVNEHGVRLFSREWRDNALEWLKSQL